jgi:hypothetical protein
MQQFSGLQFAITSDQKPNRNLFLIDLINFKLIGNFLGFRMNPYVC